MKRGFSLVELSIVLVILGLLTGGILAGQSLIRAAELRSVATDYNKYMAATRAFREKYFALPGDVTNATSFWGSLGGTGSDAVCQAIVATGTATCNGDGDGSLLTTIGATVYNPWGGNGFENTRFWQHLADAGLIEGQYTGVYTIPPVPGTNTPLTKISTMSFALYNSPSYTGGATTTYFGGNIRRFPNDYGKTFIEYSSTALNTAAAGTAGLTPQEAWNIDTKLDDGVPGTGIVVGYKGDTNTPCTNMAHVAAGSDGGAVYNLSDSSKDCFVDFVRVF